MTSQEFKYIWKNKIATNGPWRYAAIDDATTKMYRQVLIKFDKDTLIEAIDRITADDEEGQAHTLPPIGVFIKFCKWVLSDKPKRQEKRYCPCCDGSGFLILKRQDGQEKAFGCDCYIEQGNDRRIENYRNYGLNKCNSLSCQNPGGRTKVLVPRGTFKYFKKKLIGCKFRPSIVEKDRTGRKDREEMKKYEVDVKPKNKQDPRESGARG